MYVFQLSKASFPEEKTFPFLSIFWRSGCHSKGRQNLEVSCPSLSLWRSWWSIISPILKDRKPWIKRMLHTIISCFLGYSNFQIFSEPWNTFLSKNLLGSCRHIKLVGEQRHQGERALPESLQISLQLCLQKGFKQGNLGLQGTQFEKQFWGP